MAAMLKRQLIQLTFHSFDDLLPKKKSDDVESKEKMDHSGEWNFYGHDNCYCSDELADTESDSESNDNPYITMLVLMMILTAIQTTPTMLTQGYLA